MSESPATRQVRVVRPREAHHDVLTLPAIPESATDVVGGLTRPAPVVGRRRQLVLGLEVGAVVTTIITVGLLRGSEPLVMVAVTALCLVTLYHSGEQVIRPGLPHVYRIFRDMAIPIAAIALAVVVVPGGRTGRDSIAMVLSATAAAVAATLVRLALTGRVRMMVVGNAEAIARAATTFAGSRKVEVVGALRIPVGDEDPDQSIESFGIPVLTGTDDVDRLAASWQAGLVVALAGRGVDSALMRRLSWSLEGSHASLAMLSVLDSVSPHRIETAGFAGTTLVHVAPARPSLFVRLVKQAFDRTVGLVLLALAAPVMAALVLLVRLESPGPGLFRQVRIGKDGRPFTMLKIRSMCVDAETQKAGLAELNDRDDVLFKIRQDPRVTRLGAFLRRTSLDELPQLVNVVRGDMSLIGPRPALPEEVSQYDELARRRLAVRPGLTGLSQVNGRANLGFERSIELDVRYTDNWRLVDDVAIGVRTVKAVASSKGAY
ncbi:MAG TPA: exopolysaccharide biosynthesis polyprenyl glycosylphosphotransferase [Intrasporangium sp.]|nr:exopolysaccharide biosynthesis polyprenyl glycosylphosphotransferase [Intrasporangium sp.]